MNGSNVPCNVKQFIKNAIVSKSVLNNLSQLNIVIKNQRPNATHLNLFTPEKSRHYRERSFFDGLPCKLLYKSKMCQSRNMKRRNKTLSRLSKIPLTEKQAIMCINNKNGRIPLTNQRIVESCFANVCTVGSNKNSDDTIVNKYNNCRHLKICSYQEYIRLRKKMLPPIRRIDTKK